MTQPTGIWKKTIILTLAGGLAFGVTTLAISLLSISAEYRIAESISNIQTVWAGGLIIGIIIGFLVSYFLLRFFGKIPTKNPILKALILSFAAIVVIEVLSTFGNPSNAYVYLLVDTVMNIPRILALGIVIGYFYTKVYGQI